MRKQAKRALFCLLAFLFLYECSTALATPAPSPTISPNAFARDDGLILILGCVNIPGNAPPCQNDPRLDWRDWLALVRDELGFGAQHRDQFDDWSKTHIRFVHAPTANPHLIAEAVNNLSAEIRSIYLLGFSAGGGAVLNYLETLREQADKPIPPIRAAIILDSPVGDVSDPLTFAIGHYIDFNRAEIPNATLSPTDRFTGLGAWCQANGIQAAVISYEGDYFATKHPVADIPYKLIPTNSAYGGPFDLEKNHGYFFMDPNGLHTVWSYITREIFLR